MPHKITFRLFVLLFFCIITGEFFSQSAVCNYKYRKRITFDPSKVSGSADLANFPALINITSDNNLRTVANSGHVENANGYDIIFTMDDGITKLDHFLEKYTATTGELVAWVRLLSISTTYSTYIYMYYGNTSIGTDQSVNTTWNGYKGVYPLHADYNDKTGTGNNGTNTSFASTTGTIANGIASNNTGDHVSIGTTGWSATVATFELWARATGAWPAAEAYFVGHTNLPAYSSRIQIYAYNGRLRVGIGNSHSIGGDLTGSLTLNRWYHIAVMYSGGSHTVCVNGATVYAGTYSALSAIGVADIGNNGNDHTQAVTAGNIDQVMISNSARSVDWIATEYNNQSSPSTFYSISAEPNVWTGGTSTNYNTTSNWLNGLAPASGNDVIINNGTNQPTLQGNEQVGSIWIKSGAMLSLGNNSLSVRYDITNCGTLSNNTGTVNCNSTSAYATIQYFSGSGTFNMKSLSVNNTHSASPSLSLCAPATVNGTLTLTNGLLYTTSTNILQLSSTAVSTSGSSASFVSGPMSKTGTSDFIFPVGKGTRWRRCSVTTIASSDTYTAEYFNSAYSSTSPCNSPVTNVSLVEYWMVNRAGTGNAKLSLYWEDASASGITNCAQLTIARWNGASWDERPGTTSGSCSGTNPGSIITTTQLAAFSPFTFGSKTFSNPLPITLLNFTATPLNKNKVLVEWSTVSELNNDYFDIERSVDGVIFELVGKKNAKGNSHQKVQYSLIDYTPHAGVSYYRLRQVDVNGQETFSPLSTVNLNEVNADPLDFIVYPNPNAGEFVIKGNVEGAEISIYNAIGQKIDYMTGDQSPGMLQVKCGTLSRGIYFITVKLAGESKTQKLVIG